ncbi:hypothetical protein GOBAR_AA06002 [Gossypium barbadense]|uniref:Uncharacterized protein n=1 Tax=Gossypium barbadense TaxID=3634 RepID=A0A2P5YG61_GOSBA|nr:hypothetical protein GOBAR_AA06002 [Gossypium barbadense]
MVEIEKLARACETPVSNTYGRTYQINTGVGLVCTGLGEANEARHGRVTRPWAPTPPRYHVVFTRKENHRTYFEEVEGSVIFRGSNHENSHPLLPTYLELTMELCSMFHLQTVMTNYDDPGTYLHAILAHTITGRQESTGIVNIHDAYFLWCMSYEHVIDLAYFIALVIQHQTERHRKGLSPLAPMLLGGSYEDIPDDVPPQHEDRPTQKPPPAHLVHAESGGLDSLLGAKLGKLKT